jgi:hypothetical protein
MTVPEWRGSVKMAKNTRRDTDPISDWFPLAIGVTTAVEAHAPEAAGIGVPGKTGVNMEIGHIMSLD